MKNKSEVKFAELGNRQGGTPASKPVDRHRFLKQVAGSLAISLLCGGVASAQGDSPRQFIGEQVGGIQKLMVPDDAHLPQVLRAPATLTSACFCRMVFSNLARASPRRYSSPSEARETEGRVTEQRAGQYR